MWELAAKDTTMHIVTHEMDIGREVADRIIFSDGGRIVEPGPPEEVFCALRTDRARAYPARYRT